MRRTEHAAEAIREFEFALVKDHGEYIEFSISYRLEYNVWSFDGIGWLSRNSPHYYLRSLRLNKWPAARHYNKTAGISLRKQSIRFDSPVFERLVLSHLQQHFAKNVPIKD